jgi:hypothetical protein
MSDAPDAPGVPFSDGSQRPNSPRGIGARAFLLRTVAASSASRLPVGPLVRRGKAAPMGGIAATFEPRDTRQL